MKVCVHKELPVSGVNRLTAYNLAILMITMFLPSIYVNTSPTQLSTYCILYMPGLVRLVRPKVSEGSSQDNQLREYRDHTKACVVQ